MGLRWQPRASRRRRITSEMTVLSQAAAAGIPLFDHLGQFITKEPRRVKILPPEFHLTEVRVVFPFKSGPRDIMLKAGRRVIVPPTLWYNFEPQPLVWRWRPNWGTWVDISGETKVTVFSDLQPEEALGIGVGPGTETLIVELEQKEMVR